MTECDFDGCKGKAMYKFVDWTKPNEWYLCVKHVEDKIKTYNEFDLMYRLFYQK